MLTARLVLAVLDRTGSKKFCLKDNDINAWRHGVDDDLFALSTSKVYLDPFASWARSSLIKHLHRLIEYKRRVSVEGPRWRRC